MLICLSISDLSRNRHLSSALQHSTRFLINIFYCFDLILLPAYTRHFSVCMQGIRSAYLSSCATFISCWFLSFDARILFTFRAANHMQILLSRNDFVTRAHNMLICNGNK